MKMMEPRELTKGQLQTIDALYIEIHPVDQLLGHIAALEEEIVRKDADKRRLDWIEKETGNVVYDTLSYTYKVTFRVGQGAFVSDCGSLRGAIDAAMQAREEG